MLELRNDVITLLAGFHPVHEIFHAIAAQVEMIDALRKHPGKEKRVIPDVLANLALPIKRRRGAVNRIRFDQHLANVSERSASAIANLEQLFDFAELGHQMRDIVDNLRVAYPNLLCIMPSNKLNKKLLQRMRFRNHFSGPPNSASKA